MPSALVERLSDLLSAALVKDIRSARAGTSSPAHANRPIIGAMPAHPRRGSVS